VTLDDIWRAISTSAYLRSLGCRVLLDETARAVQLSHVPGIPDGTALTADRDTLERGLPGVNRLHFASYGEPAFDTILELTGAGGLPPGIRRVSVPISGAEGAELVGYIVMNRSKDGTIAPHAVLDMADLESLAIDEDTPVPVAAAERLEAQLSARARDDFRVLTAAQRIEEANRKAARAQFRLTHLVAKNFILSVQGAHRGEANWSRQLRVLEEILETGPEKRLPRMPVDELRLITGVPFAIRLPASGDEVPFDAPRTLLKAAVDLAAREAAALHRSRADVTTEQVLARL
jgi:hypothetical protein